MTRCKRSYFHRAKVFLGHLLAWLRVPHSRAQQTLSIFIQPPSIDVLAKRLENRGTESPENIATRVSKAEYEISFNQNFNAIIVNDDLEKACKEAEEVILAFLDME